MTALERLCAEVGKVEIALVDGEYRCFAKVSENPVFGCIGRGETAAQAARNCWKGVRERAEQIKACGRWVAPWARRAQGKEAADG